MSNFRVANFIVLLLIYLGLAACSATPSSTDPAALVDFKQEKRLKKVWSRSIGDGQGKAYHRIAPVLDGNEIFIAAHDGVVAAFNTERQKNLEALARFKYLWRRWPGWCDGVCGHLRW